jgi:hypothetical protein
MNEEQEPTPLLRLLEDILYNRIKQKKREMHKATERAATDKLWTEIETLQWVLGQSLNVRRQMEPNEGRYYY